MGGGYQPKRVGADRVAQAIKDLQRSVADINRRISGLGIQVDKADAEVIIAAGRSLVVNGNTLIEGSLSVPNGSITNVALQNPVSPYSAHGDGANFALKTSYTVVASVTVPVPSGYTRALVLAVCMVSCVNTSGATDNLNCGQTINGVVPAGWSASTDVPAGAVGCATDGASALITGLGSSLVITTNALALNKPWPANSFNGANVDATVLFLR